MKEGRSKCVKICLLCLASFLAVQFVINKRNYEKLALYNSSIIRPDYLDALNKYADSDKLILLVFIDTSFTDMAINFYLTSLEPHSITNFLFIGAGRETCDLLRKNGLPCFRFCDDEKSNESSLFNSPDFLRKMNIRTDMILAALKSGFSVFHSDADVFFFRNPIPELKEIISENSLAIMWDSQSSNAGFLVAASNKFTITLYEQVQQVTLTSWLTTSDQVALNTAISRVKRKYTGFSVITLDKKKYACGVEYFENGERLTYTEQRENCMVVHNNWIISKEAKIYRFKEHQMWLLDDGKYYSDEDRLFLTYENNVTATGTSVVIKSEIEALKFALFVGRVLNRIVILPKFHCPTPEKTAIGANYYLCPLNSFLMIRHFDKVFRNEYRESSFLTHPLVPRSIKNGISKIYDLSKISVSSVTVKAKNNYGGMTKTGFSDVDIISHFGREISHVLRIKNLYNLIPVYKNDTENSIFYSSIKEAFQSSDYRQFPKAGGYV